MSITIQQARENIGAGVVCRPHPDAAAEDGEITEVRGAYVFVQYGRGSAQATPPERLDFLSKATR